MRLRTQLARVKRRLLKKSYWKDKSYPSYWFDRILSTKKVFVVQIGSNDGKTGDPLNHLLNKYQHWRALFVEPVPYLFERLKRNYPDTKRFLFENVAINDGSKLTFHWVDPKAKEELDNLPYWFDQLGSFNKEHIINQLDGKLEPYILSEELNGITLETLLQKIEPNRIHILHIDTEGHDWQILSQLNLDIHSPAFILYEANHLSKVDLRSSFDKLNMQYELFKVGIDVLAVNKNIGVRHLNSMKTHLQPLNIPQ